MLIGRIMKNTMMFLTVGLILFCLVVGCSSLNPLSSKTKSNGNSSGSKDNTLPDKTIDSTIDGEKIGIPECDAVIDDLASETESEDQGYIVKAFRAYYVSKIRESIKKSIEENKSDPEKLAKECKEIKSQLDKYRAQEEEKKK